MYEKNGMNRQPIDYAVAKAGVTGLTLDLAAHLGPSGVRVNNLAPGGFAGNTKSPGGGVAGEQQAGPGRDGPPPGFIKDFSNGVALGHMWDELYHRPSAASNSPNTAASLVGDVMGWIWLGRRCF
eukprot:SAG31_NODE_8800_length_1385_cov_1.127527_1_plen_125_part_00